MIDIDYAYLKRAAIKYVYNHGGAREPEQLADDLVQAAAVRLIRLSDEKAFRVKFETMTAFQDEYCWWKYGVQANNRDRRIKFPVDDDGETLNSIPDERDPERIAMARQCIEKLSSGDDGRLGYRCELKGSREKRSMVYRELLKNGGPYVLNRNGNVSYSGSLLFKAKKSARKVYSECV